MSSLAYRIYLILILGLTASKCLAQKDCILKTSTLTVEGSINASSSDECQAKCQQDVNCKFFTWNERRKKCGLRNFDPQERSWSKGNISGLKDEKSLKWKFICNSVYVAKRFTATTATACRAKCLTDNNCKAMIFNKVFSECSLNYGKGNYSQIGPLDSLSQYGITSCEVKERSACATIYDGPNYSSDSRQIVDGENTPSALNWDQKISSFKVESGCQLTGYDYPYYRTRSSWNPKTWTSNVALLNSPYNNDISSWKCTCRQQSQQGRCPSADWIIVDDRCYLTSQTRMNQPEAQQFCTKKGGWLAEIFTSEEQKSILSSAVEQNRNYWIGLTDSAVEGHFIWQHSSKPLTWSNWYSGEPNNSGNNEDCVYYFHNDPNYHGNGQWNDSRCNRDSTPPAYALCEYRHST